MKKKTRKLSLSACGLKYKLRIVFYLILVLPTLISLYLISAYLLPAAGINLNLFLLISVSVIIGLSGFFLIKQLIDSIFDVSRRAKRLAKGEIDFEASMERHDEIGELEDALDQLTMRIKNDMKALEKYGEETQEINLEINRKVIAMSGLLQVSAFISEGAELDEIFELSAEKMLQASESDLVFMAITEQDCDYLTIKSASGLKATDLSGKKLNLKENDLLFRVIKSGKSLAFDRSSTKNAAVTQFELAFGMDSAFITVLSVHNRIAGVVAICNNRGLVYKNDTLKLIDIFIKQIVIAIENTSLKNKVNGLEVKDALTGLYNESFIKARLDEEIKRAIIYQRPCAFIIFSLGNYQELKAKFVVLMEGLAKETAVILRENLSDIDKAARLSDGEFAVVLPERNKKQAQALAEVVGKKIDYLLKKESASDKGIILSIGVSENPIDGITGLDLIKKAKESMVRAGIS